MQRDRVDATRVAPWGPGTALVPAPPVGDFFPAFFSLQKCEDQTVYVEDGASRLKFRRRLKGAPPASHSLPQMWVLLPPRVPGRQEVSLGSVRGGRCWRHRCPDLL